MTRKQALAVIVADVAQHGIAGKSAIRAFIENRLSRASFDQACNIGRQIYERGQAQQAGAVKGYWCKA